MMSLCGAPPWSSRQSWSRGRSPGDSTYHQVYCTVYTQIDHCTLRRKSRKLFSMKEPKLCKYWLSLGVSWNTRYEGILIYCVFVPVEPQTREYSILEMATFLCAFSDDGIFSPACRGYGYYPQSTYFTGRGQSYFSRLPKYWPPIPLSARRVCPPPGEGDGGSTFWKTREIGLPSYSKICTLWCYLSIPFHSILLPTPYNRVAVHRPLTLPTPNKTSKILDTCTLPHLCMTVLHRVHHSSCI